MKHRSSKILFAHWNERRGERALPERSEIDPGVIRTGLGDTFILSFNALKQHPFRLAGTRVCAIFCRELKDHSFLPLWGAESSLQIAELAEILADEPVGIVAGASGITADGETIGLELLLLPLRHWGHRHGRLIGALSSLEAPYWLGVRPVQALTLNEYRYVGARLDGPAPVLAPREPESRRRHGLIVYDGGKRDDIPPPDNGPLTLPP